MRVRAQGGEARQEKGRGQDDIMGSPPPKYHKEGRHAVLTLKENEAVVIGANIRVLVVKVMAGKQVRLDIEAPPGTPGIKRGGNFLGGVRESKALGLRGMEGV